MEWISVEDRFPPIYNTVLAAAISRYTNNPTPMFFTAYMDNRSNHWVLFGANSSWYRITHWMPIPELPKRGATRMEQTPEFEAVEVCPHCMNENVYPGWDVRKQGYTATCQHCGAEILLCDECQRAYDNCGYCDWEDGICFRNYGHNERRK